MNIFYSEKATKDLMRLSRGDKVLAAKIISQIEKYANNQTGNFDIKILKGSLGQFTRLRVGNYRVIFEVIEKSMRIYEVKHRQGVYK